jgi:hypothetical protein
LPDSYNDTVPPVWYYYSPVYDLSSEYTIGEVPDTSSFLNSYFKFDFYLDPITQKALFSVVLPLDGTMLIPGQTPRPEVDFHQTIKTEIENIYWLRNPEQLPETIFNGTTLDLYCTVSFFNYKNSKTTRFKINNHLPNSSTTLTSFTSRDYYIKYILNYNTLKYNITDIDGGTLLNNNRIKLYAV